jgi:hypothetical protein
MKRLLAILALVPALVLSADLPPESTVSYTDTAGVTGKLTSGRKLIHCTTDCYYVFGQNSSVAATTTSIPLSAGQLWEVDVIEGWRYISFVRQSASGTAYVSPVVQ